MTDEIKYDIFISHSSKDKWFSDRLYKLLDKAGFSIWYDYMSLIPNKERKLDDEIRTHLYECRNMIVVLSKNSIESEWVKLEAEIGKDKNNNIANIIWVKIDDCDLSKHHIFNSNEIKYIDCKEWMGNATNIKEENAINIKDEKEWDPYNFFMILAAIYRSTEKVRKQIDIYTSFPWSSGSLMLKNIFPKLKTTQYRFIGDANDHASYDNDGRIKKIMSTCGGFVGILPYRDDPKNNHTSHYILDEISQAKEIGLQGVLFADSRVDCNTIKEKTELKILSLDTNYNEIENHLDDLKKIVEKQKPSKSHVFFATNLNLQKGNINDMVTKLASIVTATPCITGDNIANTRVQEQIADNISKSYVMIADITGDNQCKECEKGAECLKCKKGKSLSFRLNTCIEAGIARGAKVDLYLISQGNRQSPPFMFSDINVRYYNCDCELLAIIHQILRTHRRSVLNFDEICKIVSQTELEKVQIAIKDNEKAMEEEKSKSADYSNDDEKEKGETKIQELEEKIEQLTDYQKKLQKEFGINLSNSNDK